jgi:ABC-type antimicrobial peptide transport system permease subunit
MLVHAAVDILSMVVSNTEASITGSITVYLFQTIVEVVMIGLTVWLLTGRRRQTMQWTLDRIMPKQSSLAI